MEFDHSNDEQNSILKLSYFFLPNKDSEPREMLSPPRKPLASIPFKWEEVPGRPKPIHSINNMQDAKPEKCLELPPRLLNEAILSNSPSPSTVLDGPYDRAGVQALSSFRKIGSSFRSPGNKEKITFASTRWDVVAETKVKMASGGGKSFLSFSNTKSQKFLVSIYEGFKQIVPRKRRQEKWRRMSA